MLSRVLGSNHRVRFFLVGITLVTQSVLADPQIIHGTWNGQDIDCVAGRVILAVTSDTGWVALDSLCDVFQVLEEQRVPRWRLHIIRFSTEYSVFEVCEAFSNNPNTLFCTPDRIYESASQDTYWDLEWNFKNTGQYGGLPGADLMLEEAHAITRGNRAIKIAILDSGIPVNGNPEMLSHPDLMDTSRIILGCMCHLKFDSTLPHTFADVDVISHGTSVAGLALAETDNDYGLAGVCPGCTGVIEKIFHFPARFNTSSLVCGFNDADSVHHVRIVQLSAYVTYNDTLAGVIASLMQGGMIFTFATGNQNGPVIHYPANLATSDNSIFAVGGTDRNDERWHFGGQDGYGSNYGQQMTVVAPAGQRHNEDLCYPLIIERSLEQTSWNLCDVDSSEQVQYNYGTSYAAPQVAGLLGLLLSYDSTLTPLELKALIDSSADDVNHDSFPGWDQYLGWGRINAFKALLRAPGTKTLQSSLRIRRHIYDAHSPYYLVDELVVPEGDTLTIEDSARITFAPGARIIIEGVIKALGSATGPIILEPLDSTATWGGLKICSTDTGNVLDHVIIRHARTGVYVKPDAYLAVRHSTIENCTYYGAAYRFGKGVLSYDTLRHCGRFGGFLIDGEVTVAHSVIAHNAQGGMRLARGTYVFEQNTIDSNGVAHDTTRFPWAGLEVLGAQVSTYCNTVHHNEGPGVFLFAGGYAAMNHFTYNQIHDNMRASALLHYDYGQVHFQGGLAALGDGANSIYTAADTGMLVQNSLLDEISLCMVQNYWGTTDSANIASRLPPFAGFQPCYSTSPACGAVLDTSLIPLDEALFEQGWDQEHQGLFATANSTYDSLVNTFPKSPFALIALDRIAFCDTALNWTWSDIRNYFLDLAADSSKDTSIVRQCQTIAAWCLANLGDYEDATKELQALVDSSKTTGERIRNQLMLLLVDLKLSQSDSLFRFHSDEPRTRQSRHDLDAIANSIDDEQEASLISFSDQLDALVHPGNRDGSPPIESVFHPVIPSEYKLYPNYPNPFNPNTEIRFDLPEAQQVEVIIFNTLGQRVNTLMNNLQPAGSHRVFWNGQNHHGAPVASGFYIYQIKAGHFTDSKKMLLLR